ncbi:hypothetical protein EV121DRAFT_261744 [Schizophyllum commune]
MSDNRINTAVPNSYEYFPLNVPAIGTFNAQDGSPCPKLFEPLTLKGVTFNNRIFVSPMCQYSSDNGHATDWHFVHVGGFATRGVGAIIMEATAVVPEGRISPEDAGLWTDSQIAPLKRIVDFAHSQGTKIGIQLGHAGRKASTLAPWIARRAGKGTPMAAGAHENGWPDDVVAPSAIPYADGYPHPKEITEQEMQRVEDAFVAAIGRAKQVGYDFIEIHAAHGYLLSTFCSPLANVRTDQYGGQPLENRLRYPLRIAKACREAWADKPLFVRVTATDWAAGPEKDESGKWLQWGPEQTAIYAGELKKLGVDLVDCSSGGNYSKQVIPPVVHGYQVPYAEIIKKANPGLVVATVGNIYDPKIAESYLQEGKADVILLARELIRHPHWAITAGKELVPHGLPVKPANQYERGFI